MLKRLPPIPRIGQNIVANFVGTFWTALMGPALVAVYIRFLGPEAYGLVGFFTTLQVVFALLDLGLSAATNRELARFSSRADTAHEARDLVRTAEIIYWSMSVLIGVIVIALSPLFAQRWIRAEYLSAATIQQSFVLMGFVLACQFPFALYSGGLNGLQRQIPLNIILIVMATLRGLGSVVLLWLVAPSIQLFFGWQLIVTVLQTGVTAVWLWRSLPASPAQPRFSFGMLSDTWRFAAGMLGISFFALLVTQTDKIVLSRLLPLERFGYYSLATVASSSLYLFTGPIFAALFPRFSQLVAVKDEVSLRELYHRGAQILSVLLVPTALTLAFFAQEILFVWTGDGNIVRNTHMLLSILAIGTALNGFMNVPYALQLANGWTRLALIQNFVAVIVLLPCLFWATSRFGGVGAAWIWVAVNAGYVVLGIQVMHTRLLKGEKLRWYMHDIGLPLLGASVVVLVGRWLIPSNGSKAAILFATGGTFGLSLFVAAFSAPLVSRWLRSQLRVKKPESSYDAS